MGHDGCISALVVSVDGRWVATGSFDTSIILWDAKRACISQEWIAHDDAVEDLAFSPDGQSLVSAGDDGKVKIWDITENARIVAVLEASTDAIYSCAWSSNGAWIAAIDTSGAVQLWDARTFQRLRILDELKGIDDSGYRPNVTFLRDSRWLVASRKGAWGAWNVPTGTFKTFEKPSAKSQPYRCHPGSRRLAVSYSDGGARIWNVETGEALVLPRAHSSHIYTMKFSLDDRLVLSASRDELMNIWDADTGAMAARLEGHKSPVYSACFSPCGKYVASASADKTVRIWRARDGSCLETLSEHSTWVMYIAFTPDGEMVWSADSGGAVIGRQLADIVPDVIAL